MFSYSYPKLQEVSEIIKEELCSVHVTVYQGKS